MEKRTDEPLVLGLDIGGTSTRCVLVDHGGREIGRGTGGGASVLSSPAPAASVTDAVRGALGAYDAGRVQAVTVGAAAAGSGHRAQVYGMLRSALTDAGVTVNPTLVTDIDTAFASATTSPDGVVLLAGTGAIGGLFADRVLVRRSDGHGWLLGDVGSAVWQGRRAVQAVLAAHDERGPATALTPAVAEAFGLASPGDLRQDLIAYVYARPPAVLGELAPLVARLCDDDAVAARIVDDAVHGLLATVEPLLRRASEHGAVTVGGSVLLRRGPVGDRVRASLRERTGQDVLRATDGAAGAAALALTALPDADPQAHARLVEAARLGADASVRSGGGTRFRR